MGVGFAGSPQTIADGVHIAGVDVGGLTPTEARRLLDRKAERFGSKPVAFTAGSHTWRIPPSRLGVQVNWAAAVDAARREGDGFGPVRGFRRIGMRVFGADVTPSTRVWGQALTYQLRLIRRGVDRPHRDAAVELRGLRPVIAPERAGRALDRQAAGSRIVRALASFERTPVVLPVKVDLPRVTRADLIPVVAQVRRAVSAPVRLALGETRWFVPRWRVAKLLRLPRGGSRSLQVAGLDADRYFSRLSRRVDHPPRNADFAVSSAGIRIVPDQDGMVVDVEATRRALLSAALAPSARTATVKVVRRRASRTTARAGAMGIRGMVSSYETIYGGDPNRIHNVQLVAHLIDRKLIPPGATFSFNETTGDRTADKGFLEAPVIINGELKTGLGGGICQVSTTVFNAAYEAGLAITARTNHALYISHYPLARDATVNYPDTDLRFVNDTPHWLLLRTFVGSSSLVVNLYGTPVHRRVVSDTAPLVETGPTPVTRVGDPALYVGETVTDSVGSPPRSTSVRRLVYSRSGKLLHNDLWSSYYRGELTVLRVGTKPRPKPKPASAQPKAPTTTATTTTTTTPTTTEAVPTTTTPATTTTQPTPTTPSPQHRAGPLPTRQ